MPDEPIPYRAPVGTPTAPPVEPNAAPPADPNAAPAANEEFMEKLGEMMTTIAEAAIAPLNKRQEAFESRFPVQKEPEAGPEPMTKQEYFADPQAGNQRIAKEAAERVYDERGSAATKLAYETAVDNQLRALSESDPDYIHFVDEFKAIMAKMGPEQLVQKYDMPDGSTLSGMQYAFNGLIGGNRELLAERQKEAAAKIPAARARVPHIARPDARSVQGAPTVSLDEEQLKVAKRLGVNGDDYLKELKVVEEGGLTSVELPPGF